MIDFPHDDSKSEYISYLYQRDVAELARLLSKEMREINERPLKEDHQKTIKELADVIELNTSLSKELNKAYERSHLLFEELQSFKQALWDEMQKKTATYTSLERDEHYWVLEDSGYYVSFDGDGCGGPYTTSDVFAAEIFTSRKDAEEFKKWEYASEFTPRLVNFKNQAKVYDLNEQTI